MSGDVPTARSQQVYLKPGARDDRDPDYLVETADVDDVELWLCECLAAVETKIQTTDTLAKARKRKVGGYFFTDWEREFIRDLDRQWAERWKRGYDIPLTGKQLVFLKRMFRHLTDSTRKLFAVEESHGAMPSGWA